MAQPGSIYIGPAGAEILISPYGRTFSKRILEGAREDRTVNGRMIKDIKWRKMSFLLSYSLIDGDTLEVFRSLLDLQTELSFRHTDSDGIERTYTVHMKPFSARRLVLIADGLWSGANMEFEEA